MAKVGAITALTDTFFNKMLTSVKNKLKRYAKKGNLEKRHCLENFATLDLAIMFGNLRNSLEILGTTRPG